MNPYVRLARSAVRVLLAALVIWLVLGVIGSWMTLRVRPLHIFLWGQLLPLLLIVFSHTSGNAEHGRTTALLFEIALLIGALLWWCLGACCGWILQLGLHWTHPLLLLVLVGGIIVDLLWGPALARFVRGRYHQK